MARVGYFDTFSGLSGDMTLGALLDAGLDLDMLSRGLQALNLGGFHLKAEKVHRGPFQATRARVIIEEGRSPSSKTPPLDRHPHRHQAQAVHEHAGGGEPHRHLADILALIQRSALPEPVRAQAGAVFERLAGAEAKVHGLPVEEVHFHEVGAVDSIVDIAAACLGLHLLRVEEVWFSAATVGTGSVRGAHGEMPLPAPATLELLRGIPVRQRESGFELTTPTGAALAATLARGYGPMPPMVVESIGYGAGDDRPGPLPNVLRLVLGEKAGGAVEADRVISLETGIDDMSPQWLGYLVDRLLEAGALDVTVTPLQMKKGRSAHEVRVLAPLGKDEPLADLLFRETTTFGIRRAEVDRLVLSRGFETVTTPWGEVRVKVGRRGGQVMSAVPEYEDIQRAARAGAVPLKEVHRRALEEFHRRHPAGG